MILSNIGTYTSSATAVNGTDTFDMPSEVTERAHVFLGLTFNATPGAGTLTIKADTVANPGVYQSILNATTADATAAMQTYSLSGNVKTVQVTTDSITTAATYTLQVIANLN